MSIPSRKKHPGPLLRSPLKLHADNFTSSQRTPWGGTRIAELKRDLGVKEGTLIGESWEISSHSELESRVGEIPITSLIPEIPFLVKLIDTRDWLSVQVHPKADYSGLKPGEHSKNEAWYILDLTPLPPLLNKERGSEGERSHGIYLGFKEGVSRNDVQSALDDGSDLTRLLNFIPVKPGDVYFVQAGVPHAIGPGLFIYEIQETSSTTYRYFDFNRKDKNGNPRPLHKEDAIAATDWKLPWGTKLISQLKKEPRGNCLLSTPYFEVRRIDLKKGKSEEADSSSGLHGFTVLKGALQIKPSSSSAITLSQGESAIIPTTVGRYTVTSLAAQSFVLLARTPS